MALIDDQATGVAESNEYFNLFKQNNKNIEQIPGENGLNHWIE